MIRVLYLDGDPTLLGLGMVVLEQDGETRVVTAESVQSAIALLQDESFDAIVSGHRMPDLDGIAFLQHVRSKYPALPFILFTGGGNEEAAISAYKAGVDLYVRCRKETREAFSDLGKRIRECIGKREAEKARCTKEALNTAVIEDQTDLIARMLPDGTLVFANDAFCRYFGIPRANITGSNFRAYLAPIDQEKVSGLMQGLTPDNPMGEINHRIVTEGGSELLVHWICLAIFDPEGKPVAYQWTGRDIIAPGNAGVPFPRSDKKFKSLFNNAVFGIFLSTPEGKLVDANPALARISGYSSPEEMVRGIQNLGTQLYARPEDRKRIVELLESKGIVRDYELEIRHKDGHHFMGLMNAQAVRNDAMQVRWYQGTIHDITPLRHAESELARKDIELNAAYDLMVTAGNELKRNYRNLAENRDLLAKSEENYHQLFMNMPNGFVLYEIILDEDSNPVDGRILAVNPVAEKMLRMPASQLVGTTMKEVNPWVDPGRITEYGRVALTGEPKEFEVFSPANARWYTVFAYSPDRGKFALISSDTTEKRKADDALRRSEEWYRTVITSLTEGIWVVNRDSVTTYVNPRMAEMLGYIPAETEGRLIFDFIEPDATANVPGILNGRVAGGSEVLELTLVKRDGSKLFTLANFGSSIDLDGNVTGTIAGISDITDLKNAEIALAANEIKVQSLIASLNEGVWALDAEGRTIYTNPCMAEMLGYTSDEMMGRHLFEFMDGEGKIRAGRNIDRRKQGVREQHEVEYLRKDGSKLYALLNSSPLFDAHGKYLGAIAGVMDITAKKKAEASVRESEVKYRKLFDHMTCGVAIQEAVLDTAGRVEDLRIIKVNPAFERMLGVSSADLVGMTTRQFNQWADPAWIEVYGRVALEGITDDFEFLFPGTNRWYSIHAYSPEHGMVAMMITDITEKKMAICTLAQSVENYRAAAASLSEGILIADPSGIMTMVSPQIASLLGYSQGEMAGRSISEIVVFHDDNGSFEPFPPALLELGTPECYEVRLTGKDGLQIQAIMRTSPLSTGSGVQGGATACSIGIPQGKSAVVPLAGDGPQWHTRIALAGSTGRRRTRRKRLVTDPAEIKVCPDHDDPAMGCITTPAVPEDGVPMVHEARMPPR